MGTAILKAFLKSDLVSPSDILVVERSAENRQQKEHDLGVRTSANPHDLTSCETVLLGVKPQSLPDLICPDFDNTILISMLAGVKIETLKTYFPNSRNLRIMPNLGMAYGSSTTALFWEQTVSFTPEEKNEIAHLLAQGGTNVELQKEDDFHMFTMLCGSSPAYFLYLMEFLESQGENFDDPKSMITHVLQCTLDMIKNSTDSFAQLRQNITSKGGVTNAAVSVLEQNKDIFEEMIQNGIKQSRQLGNESID